jgi:pilus assembly protein CpaB
LNLWTERTISPSVLNVPGMSKGSAGFNPGRRSFLHNLGRAMSWHRRKLAVVAAIAAILTAVAAAAPTGPPTLRVVRATGQLASGSVVSASDVEVDEVVEAALPRGALSDPAAIIGSRLVGPVADNQVLTGLDVVTGPAAAGAGHVVAPLRLADPDLGELVRPGALIDVIAADPEGGTARVIATAVRVLTVPPPPREDDRTRSAENGVLVLVDVDAKTATLLAEAAASSRISIVLRL